MANHAQSQSDKSTMFARARHRLAEPARGRFRPGQLALSSSGHAANPPMLSTTQLSALLVRIAHGDQDAFGRFYDATSQTVFGMVLSVVGDRRRAEAVARDVYVTAWKSAPTFDSAQKSPRAWLAAIAGAEIKLASSISGQRPAQG